MVPDTPLSMTTSNTRVEVLPPRRPSSAFTRQTLRQISPVGPRQVVSVSACVRERVRNGNAGTGERARTRAKRVEDERYDEEVAHTD